MAMNANKHGRPPGESEFSWGAGLTPPGLADALPSQGGRYHGTAPPVDTSPAAASAARGAEARRTGPGGAS